MSDLPEKVKNFIRKYELLEPGMRVVVGVSGGADSVALLSVLNEISRSFSLELHVAHLNHLLRQEAGEDAAFVRRFARELGIPVTVGYARVSRLAAVKKMGIEDAGRWARYRFLHHVAERVNAQRIAVGHHAGDQVETVLLNILRGAGPKGLSGMPPRRGMVIRPFLDVTRKEIEEYCGARLLTWRTDASNLTTDYRRNRLRRELLPYLREKFNPGVDRAILQLAEIMGAEDAFLEELTGRILRRVLWKRGKGEAVLNLEDFLSLPPAVCRRLLRRAIREAGGSLKDLGYRHIINCLEFLRKNLPGGELQLPHGVRLKKGYDNFRVIVNGRHPHPAEDPTKSGLQVVLQVPGETPVPALGFLFQAEVRQRENLKGDGDIRCLFSENYQVCFDYDKMELPLTVRTRQAGDRIRPFGLNGTKKLKKLFGELRIPPEERDRVPLVTSGEEICWVVGYRRGCAAPVLPETRRILILRARKLPGENKLEN